MSQIKYSYFKQLTGKWGIYQSITKEKKEGEGSRDTDLNSLKKDTFEEPFHVNCPPFAPTPSLWVAYFGDTIKHIYIKSQGQVSYF